MSEPSPPEVAIAASAPVASVPSNAKSAPNETDLRVNPKEADRVLKRLDQAITDLSARLTLKLLIYKAAPKIEEMLKLGGTYENVAEVLGAELNIAIRSETVRRHLTAWRAEQRQQQATVSSVSPASAAPSKQTDPVPTATATATPPPAPVQPTPTPASFPAPASSPVPSPSVSPAHVIIFPR